MTKAEIRELVRDKLDDGQFDAGIIDAAANHFQNEVFNSVRSRLMETTATITAAQGAYVTSDLPANFKKLIAISATSPTVFSFSLPDALLNYNQFMGLYPGYATYTQGEPRVFTVYGTGLRFSAPVNAAYTFMLDYLRRPTKMVGEDAVSDVPDDYEEMMVIGTLARVMEVNEDYNEADKERAKLAPMITNFRTDYGRGQFALGPTVMRTGRGRRSWSAKDF